jgi:hypothetical protein
MIRTHYRYPHVSDRKLEFGLYAVSSTVAVISVVFVPSPWRYLLLVLVLALFIGNAVQIRRRYRAAPSWQVRNHEEATARDALIRQHFTVTPETYTIACNYCDWKTNDYARRLVEAPRHLHNEHPSRDPRIPTLLRRRWMAWLGRLVTLG